MAAGTSLSRATGLVRTMALAAALGVTALGDAYNIANTAPNMLFQLAAGGLLSSAVVPLLARQEDERRSSEVASVLMGLVLAAGATASLVLASLAPTLMRVLSAGARARSGYDDFVAVGTSWLRMFSPQVALYGVSVLSVGILQSRGRLGIAALAPVATNVVTIAAAGLFLLQSAGEAPTPASVSGSAVRVLGWGTTAGVAAMAAIQLRAARRAVPGLRARVAFRDPAIRELRRLGSWLFLYVAANQVGYVAVVALASSVEGGVSAYQWAFTLMQLPYAVIAVSVQSASYPAMARAAGGDGDLGAELARSARVTLAVLTPAAAGLALLAPAITNTVVGRPGAGLVAAALGGFAASLLPFSLFQLLTRACYARVDGRTPALVNVVVNVVNVAVDVAVVVAVDRPGPRIAGLAVGHAVSYVVGCLVLSRKLSRAAGVHFAPLLQGARRVAAATAAMAGILAAPSALLADVYPRFSSGAGVVLVATSGAGIFVLVMRLLGARGAGGRPDA